MLLVCVPVWWGGEGGHQSEVCPRGHKDDVLVAMAMAID